jgi:hypothetical protein
MVFRRTGREEEQDRIDEDDDGLNILSDDDDEDDEEEEMFAEGELCWACQSEPGRVGVDPTCHGVYTGEDGATLLGYDCLAKGLKDAYARTEGIAVIVEPFADNKFHLYYRLDEMPAYQFPRSLVADADDRRRVQPLWRAEPRRVADAGVRRPGAARRGGSCGVPQHGPRL